MIFPAAPVRLTHVSQIKGLDEDVAQVELMVTTVSVVMKREVQ